MANRRLEKLDADIQPEEIRFFNLMKIILDAGWNINGIVFGEMIKISGID